ncbi:PNPOx family protein [Niabella drilacis]|uniref:Ig-like domain (Group 2) n=1 Tax=Niabella drilacis (strain DSM 25811 / CCM 8410 / CCUG 62505 / LMG 26954 / E90) TaxID=1285928 RepID=A0A1G6JKQ2_NIADE|nr:hypothetical protein [Niabella drilacis]SDC19294.1 hypothetical protein SAMN04487894_101565 [Niabella drilacis]
MHCEHFFYAKVRSSGWRFLLLLLLFASCKKSEDVTFGSKDVRAVSLGTAPLELMEGDTVALDLIFNSRATEALYKDFSWTVKDPAIARLEAKAGVAISLVGLDSGATTVAVVSSDQRLKAEKTILVSKSFLLTDPVYINFGVTPPGAPFNSVSAPQTGRLANLADSKGVSTGINLDIIDDFEGENGSGMLSNTLGLPSSVSGTAFWGSNNNPAAVIKLSNLNRNRYYDLSFYGSRRDVADNRETQYTVTGRYASATVAQNASGNGSVISTVKNVRPTTSGDVVIAVKAGPNNNNGLKYFYLNAIMIEPSK